MAQARSSWADTNGAAVVQIHGVGNTAWWQPGPQGRLGPQRVLGGHPPIARHQPGVVIQEREQDRLAAHMIGPCRASPTHNSFGADASNRPKARAAPRAWRVIRCRRKWRWIVRSFGAQP